MSRTPAFSPSPWLPGGHAMTVASALLDGWRRPALPEPERRLFETAPGTQVQGLWHAPPEPDAPVVILLHGLTGDANAGYMRGATRHLLARGMGVLRLNTRNCGGTEHLTDTLYHAGLTDDVKVVLQTLVETGHRRLALAGFSMGGNVALKAAGELSEAAPAALKGVAAVSPPVDLGAASDAIDRGFMNGIYQRAFLGNLRRMVARKATATPERYDLRALSSARTLRLFDDRFVAPGFGFDGADDYYRRASAGPWLDRIRVPTLVVHAEDDSIVPAGPLVEWAARAPKGAQLRLQKTGGHVGFVQSRRGARASAAYFWAEAEVADFVARVTADP